MLKRAAAALAIVIIASAAACAGDLPAGWTQGADGSFTHADSGVFCAPTVGTFTLVRLDAPTSEGALGTCIYSGGTLRVGQIRVRRFIDGVGETPLAIQNDRTLMGVAPGPANMPPGGKLIAANRIGPGPQIDGTETQQIVITDVRKGFLVDCVAQTKRDKDEMDFGFKNFVSICMHHGD